MTTANSTFPLFSLQDADWTPAETATATTLGVILLSAAVTLTTFDFQADEEVSRFSVNWQTLWRLGVCGACGAYGLFNLRYTARELFRFPGAWAMLFALWAMMTVPLGIAQAYSAAACFALLCMVLFAPAVLVHLSGRQIVWTIVVSHLVFIVASWALYLAGSKVGMSRFMMPDGEIIWRLGGDSQQLGLQAAWAIGLMLVLGFAGVARWPFFVLPLALAAITLPHTQSRTAILSAAAATAVVVLRRISLLQAIGAGLVALMIGSVALLVLPDRLLHVDVYSLQQRVSRSGNPEELYNLTGRTEIWQHAMAKWRQSPILGWGYGCSRHVLADYAGGDYGTFELHHAHNLLLNVAICTGVVGAAILVGMLLSQVVQALRRPDVVPDMAVALVLVAGIAEPLLFGPMPRSHTVIWLIALFWRQFEATVCPADKESEMLGSEDTVDE